MNFNKKYILGISVLLISILVTSKLIYGLSKNTIKEETNISINT